MKKVLLILAIVGMFAMPMMPVKAYNPVKKYAIIVAVGASTKLRQTQECGSSTWRTSRR